MYNSIQYKYCVCNTLTYKIWKLLHYNKEYYEYLAYGVSNLSGVSTCWFFVLTHYRYIYYFNKNLK